MGSQVKGEGRTVNWSYPMNPTHLPPKSPSLYNLGSPMFDSAGSMFMGRNNYPNRTVGQRHQRTPSTGFLPQMQPSWLDEACDLAEVSTSRGHRRSSSDSVAFLDSPGHFGKIDLHISEDDEFDARTVASIPTGAAADFDKLDEEQLMSMFADIDTFQRPPSQANEGPQQRIVPATNNACSTVADSWTSERRAAASAADNPSTPSDSNSHSHSEVSNEDARAGGLGRLVSEPEVQSIDEEDDAFQQPLIGDSLSGCHQIDPNLDPKRAKRILANRQSAQRSRVRKLQYISELERSVSALQTEVATLSPQVAYLDHQRVVLNMDNNALKQQIATLAQDKRFKDAHYESLRKEAQRLRALQQQQQQVSPSCSYELQQQQFSKLDLGTSTQAGAKLPASDTFLAKSAGGVTSMLATASRAPGRSQTQPAKGISPPSCMVAGTGKKPEGRMVTGSSRLPSDFMVKNP